MKKENIAFIIFLALILGAGVYFYTLLPKMSKNGGDMNLITQVETKKPVDINQWRDDNLLTCRSEKYGYEFKYPKDWYMSGVAEKGFPPSLGANAFIYCSQLILADLAPNEKRMRDDGTTSIIFSLRTQEDLSKSSLKGVTSVEEMSNYLKSHRGNPSYDQEALVAGEKALWTGVKTSRDPAYLNGSSNSFILFHDGIQFIFNINNAPQEIQEKFLSTFKFLK